MGGQAKVYVGTSGYSYKDWVGPFYPPGTPANRMLDHYLTQFPAMEINSTYYKMPSPRTMRSIARRAPPGYPIWVKAHRDATHERRDPATSAFLAGIDPIREEGRNGGILLQFPQSFKYTPENRVYLARITGALKGWPLAVEFRDASWDRESVYQGLAEREIAFVMVDEPDIAGLFPRTVRVTSPTAYLRFHSRNRSKWYQGGAARYDYNYSTEELLEWAGKLQDAIASSRSIFVFFNNCHGGQAAENARRMAEILRGQSEAHVVDPSRGEGPAGREEPAGTEPGGPAVDSPVPAP